MTKFQHYQILAELFRYPDGEFLWKIEAAKNWLKASYPEAAAELEFFYQELPRTDLNQIQALYTRSFDVQAITTLDVAYVLFGDDYKRGEILANLNREHIKFQTDCGVELADYLPNLLSLISRLEDGELLRELVQEILAPALQKMIEEFIPERLDKKNELYKKHYKTLIEVPGHNVSVYQHALKALYGVLRKDFDVKEKDLKNYSNCDFLNSVSTEMDVEKVSKE
ncbi:MAG: hypothetical protein KBC91_01965 [Candidatus Omnitrophica bacterium]|nr:hypothetical protein [Candidatus Omnitrophota bacterium]